MTEKNSKQEPYHRKIAITLCKLSERQAILFMVIFMLLLAAVHAKYFATGYGGAESDFGAHFAIINAILIGDFVPPPYHGIISAHLVSALAFPFFETITQSMLFVCNVGNLAALLAILLTKRYRPKLDVGLALFVFVLLTVPVFAEMTQKGYFSAHLVMSLSPISLFYLYNAANSEKVSQGLITSVLFGLAIASIYPDFLMWSAPLFGILFFSNRFRLYLKYLALLPVALAGYFFFTHVKLIGLTGGAGDHTLVFQVLALIFLLAKAIDRRNEKSGFLIVFLVSIHFGLTVVYNFFEMPRLAKSILLLDFVSIAIGGLITFFDDFIATIKRMLFSRLVNAIFSSYLVITSVLCVISLSSFGSLNYYPLKNVYWSVFLVSVLPLIFPSRLVIRSSIILFLFLLQINAFRLYNGKFDYLKLASFVFPESSFDKYDERCARKLRKISARVCRATLAIPGSQKFRRQEGPGDKILRGVAYNSILDEVSPRTLILSAASSLSPKHGGFWEFGFLLAEDYPVVVNRLLDNFSFDETGHPDCFVLTTEVKINRKFAVLAQCFESEADYVGHRLIRLSK